MRSALRLLPIAAAVLACGRSGFGGGSTPDPSLPGVTMTAASVSSESLLVEWSAVEGATSYAVRVDGVATITTALSLSLPSDALDHAVTVAAILPEGESAPGCELSVRPIGIGTAGLVLRSDADATIPGPGASSRFGVSFAAANTDGDAYGDLFVGAPGYLGGGAFFGRGRVQLHKGSASGLTTPIAWSTSSVQLDAGLGSALAAGNVDGAGTDELVLGVSRRNFGAGALEGVLFWFVGLPPDGVATYNAPCTQADCEEGFDVAIRDVTGDGRAETFSSAPTYDSPDPDEGALFRYSGAAAGAPPFSGTIVDGDLSSRFGDSMALGDFDGDGTIDIAGGGPRADRNALTDQGVVIACQNAATDLDCPWTLLAGQAGAEYGQQLAAGDVNGDGFADLAVAAPLWDGTFPNEGRIFVHLGSAAGPSPAPDFALALGGSAANLGFGLAALDVNRDGYDDVLAGATGIDGEAGAVGLWLGSPSGPAQSPSWTRIGLEAGERLHRPASAGDVNGDGAPDVVLGSTRWSTATGRISVFHGPPLDGPRIAPGEPRIDGARVRLDEASFTDPASGPKRCTIDFGEGPPLVVDPCNGLDEEHEYEDRSPHTIHIRVENGYGVRGEACLVVDPD